MTAEAESMGERVHSEERLALLSGVPAFSRLPGETLEELAVLLREERYAAGGVVVAEGDTGDRLYLISGGHAEVSAEGSKGPVPLATLGTGEMFGEIALLEPGGKCQATVTATTDLSTLSLAAPAFHRVLDAHPEARSAFSEAAEEMLVAKFLKQASPFATLDADRLRRLTSSRLEVLYGLSSVLFIAFSAMLTVVLYRLIVQDWLSGLLTETVAAGVACVGSNPPGVGTSVLPYEPHGSHGAGGCTC